MLRIVRGLGQVPASAARTKVLPEGFESPRREIEFELSRTPPPSLLPVQRGPSRATGSRSTRCSAETSDAVPGAWPRHSRADARDISQRDGARGLGGGSRPRKRSLGGDTPTPGLTSADAGSTV